MKEVFKCSWIAGILFFAVLKIAQGQNYTLSGNITDKISGKPVEGAAISLLNNAKSVAYSDETGHYQLNVISDTVEVACQLVGYKLRVLHIFINGNATLDFKLNPDSIHTGEVIIEAMEDRLLKQDNLVIISTREAKALPSLIGEPDILRAAQLKPGIQNTYEGSAGIYVRGGGPDQSLYLLDGAPIYNPSHLFGFVSTFNSDAIREMHLYKANFPSRYGGRLSLVADVRTEEGSLKKVSVFGGIGLITSRIGIEVPVIKNKLSVKIAFRRSYYDVYTKKINKSNEGKKDYEPIPDHYFFDGNFIVSYMPTQKDKIKLSSYVGKDAFHWSQSLFDFGLNWGNVVASLQWLHNYNPSLSQKITIFYSRYKYKASNSVDVYSQSLESGIENLGGQCILEKRHK